MRRMLDPKEAGGALPSTIEFDKDGNRTASKDVKVGGKLKLNSLVSASNPDGDITKELGGKPRHAYRINNNNSYWYIVYSTKDYNFEIGKSNYIGSDFDTNDNYKELRSSGIYPANGFVNLSDTVYLSVMQITINTSLSYPYKIEGRKSEDGTFISTNELKLYAVNIVKLY